MCGIGPYVELLLIVPQKKLIVGFEFAYGHIEIENTNE